MKSCLLFLFILSCCTSTAPAEVKTKKIAYEHEGVNLVGLLAWDDAYTTKRPGVLVVHEWWGLNDYVESRAVKLAGLGYVAFALDLYGNGQVTSHPEEAGEWASQVRSNTESWRGRALAGLKVLQQQSQVDTKNMAAIGYCFGGSTVLQMAYANAPVKGVVSFHGALIPPGEDAKINSKILVCNGAADAFIPASSIQQFEDALKSTTTDYTFINYGGARHGFTNPAAGDFGIENLKYDPLADVRSWKHMQDFFAELFPQ